MPRVFACLVIGQCIVLVGTGALGLLKLDPMADRHILLAMFSLLLSCLIQVIGFTYLTVTGKTMVQAVHFGELDPAPLIEAKKIKQSFARLLALLMGAVVLATASGANLWRLGGGLALHWGGAFAAVSAHLFVLIHQYGLIARNAGLVDRTLDAYSRRRSARIAQSTTAVASSS